MNRTIAEMRAKALRAKLEATLDWMRERADVMYDPKTLDRMIRDVSRREPGRGGMVPARKPGQAELPWMRDLRLEAEARGRANAEERNR